MLCSRSSTPAARTSAPSRLDGLSPAVWLMDSTLWMVAYRYVSPPLLCAPFHARCVAFAAGLFICELCYATVRSDTNGRHSFVYSGARSFARNSSPFRCVLARRRPTRYGLLDYSRAADALPCPCPFRGCAVTNTLPPLPSAVVFIHNFFPPTVWMRPLMSHLTRDGLETPTTQFVSLLNALRAGKQNISEL